MRDTLIPYMIDYTKLYDESDFDSDDAFDYDDAEYLCPVCNGSGEGNYSGSRCRSCGGCGVLSN